MLTNFPQEFLNLTISRCWLSIITASTKKLTGTGCMDIVQTKWRSFDVFQVNGRIDGLSAADLKHNLDQWAASGLHTIFLDFSRVIFMSSAGLRVIIQTQKSLKIIGGELILISVPPIVQEVFKISGLHQFLKQFPDLSAIPDNLNHGNGKEKFLSFISDGVQFEDKSQDCSPGQGVLFGCADKLFSVGYKMEDNIAVNPGTIAYGAGLAALGSGYEDFKSLYGEAIIIQHNFYSYPAVPRASVDYSFYSEHATYSLNFLYGFGITGDFSTVLHFDTKEKPISLQNLLHTAAQKAQTNVFGVVLLSQSGGLRWMHLKKSPIEQYQQNFSDWMNFSIEAEDINKTILACGIVVKEKHKLSPQWQQIFPGDGGVHLHAAILENGLWCNKIQEFEKELLRVARNFEVEKVVHLLPGSQLKNGFIGIINLDLD
ncbi:MAG: STAS domain-containing protein [Bacteroidales bacterium]|nr:STAS domain-containing protein [Bacteroidales bacterium]